MVKKVFLKNGLRVVLVPMKGVAATALVLVEAGSEYEKKRWSGLSHFLEHMVFKGTERRPKAGTISEELDALGAEYNAFTGQEYTGYWAKAEARKLPGLLELVSDLYLHPIFDEKEIEKERGVIIEELNMYEDTPMRSVQDLFLELLYGDQPAGWNVGGTKETVRRLTRDDFVEYRSLHYVAPATAVIVAGSFSEGAVMRQLRSLFGSLPRGKKEAKPKTKESQSAPRVKVKGKKSDQTHVVLGVRAFSVFDKRRHALQLLAHILGGGMSSRLFKRVREEMGAAYYVRAEADLALDHGVFAVSSGVNHPKLHGVISAILEEMASLAHTPVPEAELRRAKDHLVGTFRLGLETSDELAMFYGGQEIIVKKLTDPDTLVRRTLAVTAKEIQALAKTLFKERALNLALIGPHESPEKLRRLLRFPK